MGDGRRNDRNPAMFGASQLMRWSLSSCSNFPQHKYFYINQPMTWFQAQNYCREHYNDLATFESYDDISMLEPTFPYEYAWIGLIDDPKSWKVNLGNKSNSWRWSVTGEPGKTTFEAWASSEPSFGNAQETCVNMDTDGTWIDTDCTNKYSFVCYTVTKQSEKVYNFFPTVKSWNSAQEYCKEHYTDLAMIENAFENAMVFSKIGGKRAWIGLYRVPWTWSDRSNSSFKNWDDTDPNHFPLNGHCGVEGPHHKWLDTSCSVLQPFICQQVTRLTTTLGMQIMTDANMTDPAVIEQFLQQIHARLTHLGWTDFKLQWKNLPSNQTQQT
ncbi:putative C-type lectin domain family 20 member A [Solea solea]|uniref:putative C-type lectin domain family 20 member A n=1 Tax=Solea solea TaxID=90069 RepID=UPI00272BE5E0|nr:putative C-type lectin domain family 20 member A [Solea solea]